MIEINLGKYGDREFLHATPSGAGDTPLPTLFFYHGFLSSKWVYSYFAVALARAGFRVIMPDADQHDVRFNGDDSYRLGHFWSILRNSIDEFPELLQLARERAWIKEGRVGVGGASMGGMTALGIMARHPQVRAVASLMGSGYFTSLSQTLFPPAADRRHEISRLLAPYEPDARLAQMGQRPLLLWHGAEDDVVPASESLRLQQALTTTGQADNLTFLLEEGVKHRITPLALTATTDFFKKHL